MPCWSTNARKFPSGEREPKITELSEELIVSWRNLTSGSTFEAWRFRIQAIPGAARNRKGAVNARDFRHDRVRNGADFSCSRWRSESSSAAEAYRLHRSFLSAREMMFSNLT